MAGIETGLLDQFPASRFDVRFEGCMLFIADDARGQFNRARLAWNPVLLDEHQFPIVRHGDDDRGSSGIDALYVLPMSASYQLKKLSFVERALNVLCVALRHCFF